MPEIASALNLAPDYDPEYAALFNIILWLCVCLILALWAITWGIWNMDPGRDGIIYRISSARLKSD
ncbi:unnamed protein product [Protopolystoma xenopodis]|uniref:Renin receptor-like C-terminal transmembrane spanning segment domain-containing protein n=1 Tax=Protopolystoma xenopodis TaxID=117903 RepID=A0A3S5ASK4_9PLAT|nr:unnamed protein product [Protopolystoma xenopodis]